MVEITTPIITDETGKKIIEAIKNNPSLKQQLKALEDKKEGILNDINDECISKTSIITSETLAQDVENASNSNVVSEKLFLEAFTWMDTM